MTDPELPAELKSEPMAEAESWQQAFQWLRNLFVVVLILLVVLSGSLNLYLYRQVSLANRQLNETRPGIERMVTDYQTKTFPVISTVVSNLQGFAKANPEFGTTVLNRYLGSNSLPATPAPKATPPAPAPASAPPPSKPLSK